MATMLVQHHVKDFAAWKKAYDSMLEVRKANGELADTLYRDAGDPNQLTLVFKWTSIENAQKWAHSPVLREAMEKAGVDGPPTINFLNEV